MTVTELIEKLQEHLNIHGDTDVSICIHYYGENQGPIDIAGNNPYTESEPHNFCVHDTSS